VYFRRKPVRPSPAMADWRGAKHPELYPSSDPGIGGYHRRSALNPCRLPSESAELESLLLSSSNKIVIGIPFKYNLEGHPLNLD